MAAYYGGRENVPPADYLSPRPIFFLTVGKGSVFCFGVASDSGDDAAAQKATDWLKRALQDIGFVSKRWTRMVPRQISRTREISRGPVSGFFNSRP